MKKFLLFFVLASTLISCSSSDDTNENSSRILQKVVFYRDTPNEKQWIINNNLLTSITLADGTVVEKFTYDNMQRVISDVKYANGVAIETNTITYNADNTIQSINGLPYTYNAATRTYAYSYGSNFTIDCTVNEDMLAVDFVRTGFNPSEYHMTYSNEDMTSFEKVSNGTSEIIKNFHFDADGFRNNRIFTAVLAVARVKSLTDPGFFIDCQASKNMANGFDKGSHDPYYYNYGELTDKDGKLYQVAIEVLDNSNNAVDLYPFVDYHFE